MLAMSASRSHSHHFICGFMTADAFFFFAWFYGDRLLCSQCSVEKLAPVIHIYDGRGENKEIALLDKIHMSPLMFMRVGVHESN